MSETPTGPEPEQPAPQFQLGAMSPQQEIGAMDVIIPTKNPPALLGYYLGVFSLIPCFGAALGPAAIVCGWLGLRKIAEIPGLPGRAHAWVAIVLGAITTLAHLLVIGLIAWAAMNQPKT